MTKKKTEAEEPMTAADLIQDEHNYRKHSETNKKRIRKSIDEAGLGRSVVVDADGVLIAGNGVQSVVDPDTPVRVIETDGTELVVVKRTDLHEGDERRKKLAMGDNAAGDEVEWDMEAIEADGWEQDELEDWGVVEVKDEGEVKKNDGDETEAKEDDFDPDSVIRNRKCKEGQVWILGQHRLMCGDSTNKQDVEVLMDGNKADMVFTDPPYGVSIGDKNKTLNEINGNDAIEDNIINDTLPAQELYKILVDAMTNVRISSKEDASYYVTSPQGGELGLMMMMMKDAGLAVRHMLIWKKNSPTFSLGRLDYDYQHEPIFYTWTKKHHCYRNGEFRSTIWEYNKPTKNDFHPTMKPVALVANCIKDSTKQGDLVIDFFGGSGTTLIAAEQLNRKCYMMELDEHYCDVIIARWEKLTGQKAVLLSK